MRKAMIVARHEFLSNARRPGYLFASFGVPLLTVGLMVLIFAIAFQSEEDTTHVGTVGYVDESGVLADGRGKPEYFTAYVDEDAARAALDAGNVGAYFVLGADYLDTGNLRLVSTGGVPDALEDDIDSFLVANLSVGLPDDEVARIQNPVEMRIRTLDSGRDMPENALLGLILIPFLLVFVMIMASQIASTYLMSGVVEEKSNRIMEILITSITPFQLLLGKMIGLGALGLLQVVVWIAMGAVALRLGQGSEFLAGVTVPSDVLVVSLTYFLLSYVLFSSVMAGIGAVVGSEQESKQIAGFVVFLAMIPMFFIIQFFEDANGTIPTLLTLIPITAPVTVMLRMSFGAIPAWQLGASLVLLTLTTLGVVWVSARVFRWSLLMYGKRPGIREIWRAVRRREALTPSSLSTS